MFLFIFVLLFLDFLYLSTFGKYFGKLVSKIQKEPMKLNFIGVIFSYILIAFALYFFILKERKPIFEAFILGVLLYGVFDFTNLALFSKYDWKILWEQSCIHNDTEISVSKDAEIIKGKYLGVNDLGELLLQNEKDEVISFSSGEVSIKGIYNK